MTISTSTSTNLYSGNGVTTVFPYTFPILDQDEILVQSKNNTTNVITTLVLTTDYTVSGVGTSSGNVTMLSAPASGTTLILSRNSPYLQEIDYTEYDTFPAITHETGLDRGVMLAQQLRDQVSQSLRFDPTISLSPVIVSADAGEFFRVNAAGTNIETTTITGMGALALPAQPGIVVYDGSVNLIDRTLTGTANEITVTDGDGQAGNPTVSIPSAVTFTGKTVTGGTYSDARIIDNALFLDSVDNTKIMTFQLSGISTATTREITVQDRDGTMYITGGVDVSVADGGTGRSTHTAYAVLCGGTSTTAAQQSVASVGTSGQVLTSNGASALPTFQNIAAAALPAGMPIQLLSTTKTDTFSTTSTTFTAITGLSQAITPSATANKVLVRAVIQFITSASSVHGAFRLTRGGTPIGLGTIVGSRSAAGAWVAGVSTGVDGTYPATCLEFFDSPSTTSSTTYAVEMLVNSGTGHINRGITDSDAASTYRTSSTITVMEVKG